VRDRFAWLLALAYAVLFSWLGSWRYDIHRNFVDFGIFAQTAASAFGCFCNAIEGSHRAIHFSPILYIAGAVVWFWHSSRALITLQAVACALTIPPVYGTVRRRAGENVARLTAIIVFLYPAFAGLTFGDFHENGFAPAAVAWTLWAFDGGFFLTTLVFASIALCVKEDQAIFLTIAGVLGAWRFRGTSAGRTALIVAVMALSVAIAFFFRAHSDMGASPVWSPERFYAWTAPDVRALFPLGLLQRLGFIVLAFAPLLFLPFRSRMMWLALAPLGEVLLSRMSTTFTLGSHYAGAWLGYVFVAFAFALRRIEPGKLQVRLCGWCIALCIVELLVADPLHPGMNLRPQQARDVALDRMLATLPSDIPVATQEEAYTHLALSDPYATLLPENPDAPVCTLFVLLDRDYPSSPRLEEYGEAFDRLVRSGFYVSVSRGAGIELYRRDRPCPECRPLRRSASAVATLFGHPFSAGIRWYGEAQGLQRSPCSAKSGFGGKTATTAVPTIPARCTAPESGATTAAACAIAAFHSSIDASISTSMPEA
jgi:uncharacterized membrane protein